MNISAEQYRNLTSVPKHKRGQALAVAKAKKTAQLLAELAAPPKRNKFNSKRTQLDGIWFDSKREAELYAQFKVMEKAGHIANFEVHPSFALEVNGVVIGKATLDFAYVDTRTGQKHVVDVKSEATARSREFVRTRKHLRAQYGFDVEVIY